MEATRLLAALKRALDTDPRNGDLWLHYAAELRRVDLCDDAIAAYRFALEVEGCRDDANRGLVSLLRIKGDLAEALIRVEQLLVKFDEPVLHAEHAAILDARGEIEAAAEAKARAGDADVGLSEGEAVTPPSVGASDALTSDIRASDADAPDAEAPDTATPDRSPADGNREDHAKAEVTGDSTDPEDWASQFDWGDLRLTLDDVSGLEEVKRQIQLRIIQPFQKPEIYQAFGRQGGGGVMLYGPPGCGKTFIARATAGECGARFVNVSLHEIVDKYWGESEKLVHALFEEARRRSPTVLFFDEFDALGGTRGRGESQFWKTLVDQLLQEMDGVAGQNTDVLLFAATNTPWNVDSAFRRPGRFDRVLFVPPPDLPARQEILLRHAGKLPGGDGIDTKKLSELTSLFTGADLQSLCERSAESALERSLETGKIHDVDMKDFQKELGKMQSTAQEWLATARNYAKYSNEGGQYDELGDFLKRSKRW